MAEPAKSLRDPRIDFFRGIALVMIFINHIPGQIYENFTSRNFGMSDAAEAFVFMAGVSAALAYGPRLAGGLNWPGLRKVWHRAWTLYLVHVFTAAWAIAIVAGAALWFGADAMLTRNAFRPLTTEPLAFLVGIPALTHQLGYVNILPMYAVLLIGAPFLIRLGQRSPRGLLAFAIGFWVLVGTFRLDLPNYPFKGGWFFNPLAWQILFSLGLLTGLALRRGQRFVPVKRWLGWLAGGYLALCAFWVNSPLLMEGLGHVSWQLQQWNVPFYIAGFDKTYVSAPLLLHILALAYVLSLPGIVPRIAASRWGWPLRVLGSQALPVFATGTILAILGQAIKEVHPAGTLQDTALIAGGLTLQFALAYIRDRIKPKKPAALHPAAGGAAPDAAHAQRAA
ncbi:MAG: OpgC domain-containing protein [Paracoccaceae bacterium]